MSVTDFPKHQTKNLSKEPRAPAGFSFGRMPGYLRVYCQQTGRQEAIKAHRSEQGDGTGIFTNGDERNPPIAAAGIPLPFRDRGKQQHSLIRFLS
ncbi:MULTISPECIES: hypothetical protein [Agrobacterium tumefaciens complex]|jgi:hypothetical protein|uniref:Uncharacterized protein n=2 Tax=Agrobacterium tumefaciens complex TaxID=1183400 RepID=A0AAW8M0G5_AGRTU|nr:MULTISPECIES: hypothetical protein [Agrobacterium tumefaciens complex]EPR23405.1 hypothetical protein L902_00255 [Agrobacterium radiobacter DSM 30147]KAB0459154.1 hypothetical protein F7R04_15215 [Agrobacterium tumefaciens]KWT75354.1 hypothetical protein ASH09_18660 [Agrobacterium radiobacter]MBB4320671.1 hypothetical protein [Agrobacterium radiobacter]MBB4337335.1 hypothetical protein [Agrobacterium radiobacter]